MQLIDTHAHLYLPQFDADRAFVIQKAAEAGVHTILLPAIDSETHEQMMNTEQEHPSCRAMMGLHPCSVKENVQQELMVVEHWLQQRRFVAVGEIGLDLYWDTTYLQQQYEAFEQQIQLALKYSLPIVVHSRNATDECIDVVKKYTSLTGVFHCFSGTVEQAKAVVDAGFMLGIGGVLTFKNAGLDKVIESMGITRVLLETDAPYLAPAPFRGKRNEPAYTKLVAEKLSVVAGMSIEEVAQLTSQNAEKLFKL